MDCTDGRQGAAALTTGTLIAILIKLEGRKKGTFVLFFEVRTEVIQCV